MNTNAPLAWAAGLEVGLRTIRREPSLGLKRVAFPVGYWRSVEFAYAWRQLPLRRGARVLDLGSPKDLAAMLARHRGFEMVATDILPEAVDLSRRYARGQGLEGRGAGRVLSEVQDGRALSYDEGSFDAAYSISVLEHIPGCGDSQALAELIRVVRPGGTVVITVPYDREYRETFVHRDVYERTAVNGEPVFFERHYDRDSLQTRLLRAQHTQVTDLSIWGEGRIRLEAWLERLGPLRLPLSPIEGLLSSVALRPILHDAAGHPMAAFITLSRSATSRSRNGDES